MAGARTQEKAYIGIVDEENEPLNTVVVKYFHDHPAELHNAVE